MSAQPERHRRLIVGKGGEEAVNQFKAALADGFVQGFIMGVQQDGSIMIGAVKPMWEGTIAEARGIHQSLAAVIQAAEAFAAKSP